jgi:hypothetical protein
MVSSANIECDPVPVLAAEHALSIVRTIAPFQQDILDNRDQLLLFFAAVVGLAILIEVAFASAAIILQRRLRTVSSTTDRDNQ